MHDFKYLREEKKEEIEIVPKFVQITFAIAISIWLGMILFIGATA